MVDGVELRESKFTFAKVALMTTFRSWQAKGSMCLCIPVYFHVDFTEYSPVLTAQ